MKVKKAGKKRVKIARDMLHRYTGCPAEKIGKYVLLTNFPRYLDSFAEKTGSKIYEGTVFRIATRRKSDMCMIQFNIGAPTAALVIDLLSSISTKAVLMLGMCGGLHSSLKVGEFILPLAAIRNDGVSRHYLPPEVPSLPTFKVQNVLAETLKKERVPYKTGVMHTTDYRFWEFDMTFKRKLKEQRVLGIEMECAALFTAGFKMKVPIGALLLVSDLPLKPRGIKTMSLQKKVFNKHVNIHIELGVQTLTAVKKSGDGIDLRHFQW